MSVGSCRSLPTCGRRRILSSPTLYTVNNARRAHLQFVPAFVHGSAGTYHFFRKKPDPRKAEGVSGLSDSLSFFPWLFTDFVSLQHSHQPVYYRLPRSRLYLGIYELLTSGGTLTRVPGLYKSGFALGVVGICYSAYSLVKVRDSSMAVSHHSTENAAHHRGGIKRYYRSV